MLHGITRPGRQTLRAQAKPGKERKYRCQCACGNLHDVTGSSLRRGNTKSCGRCPRPLTLIRQYPKEYESYRNMRKRCLQKNSTKYYLYGAEGVTIATTWLNSFTAFLADIGPKPSPQHSIDRWPNPYGNYIPSNTRWATPKQQANN